MTASEAPSGILLVDKPVGVTSHDVVAAVRGALHTRHVGHAGTLDPLASGLLVVGVGFATRLLTYVVGTSKTYEAVIRLGASTTTDDSEGEMVSAVQPASVRRSIDDYAGPEGTATMDCIISSNFTGTVQQVPSTFSAIKVKGQRAYELARSGEEVHLEARSVTIHSFERLSQESHVDQASGAHYLDVRTRITCSAGTYIRALARDLGTFLGVGGYLISLRRTRVGNYQVEDAVASTVEPKTYRNSDGQEQTRLHAHIDGVAAAAHLVPAATAVAKVMPTASISQEQARDLGFGRPIDVAVEGPTAALLERAGEPTRLCAIVEPSQGRAQPSVVFPSGN